MKSVGRQRNSQNMRLLNGVNANNKGGVAGLDAKQKNTLTHASMSLNRFIKGYVDETDPKHGVRTIVYYACTNLCCLLITALNIYSGNITKPISCTVYLIFHQICRMPFTQWYVSLL